MPLHTHSIKSTKRRAFTLAESLAATIVLALAVVGVSGAIIASQQQIHAQEEDSVAAGLARQLMEDIAVLPINTSDATTGWPTTTDRTLYDSVIDYNGYTEVVSIPIHRSVTVADTGTFSSASPSSTAITSGTPTLGAQQYSRVVSVTYPTSIFGQTVSAGEFAVIGVTVKGSSGVTVSLSRIVARNTVSR
ncbi:MAG TPA: type II secretion system protein [Tepidisphaeraceae bacterium]|nr:type II secretion system protein [Tepidisphaeraceae bacterium]